LVSALPEGNGQDGITMLLDISAPLITPSSIPTLIG